MAFYARDKHCHYGVMLITRKDGRVRKWVSN